MRDAMTKGSGLAVRGLSALLALAVFGASTSVAYAQPKPPGAKPAAPAAPAKKDDKAKPAAPPKAKDDKPKADKGKKDEPKKDEPKKKKLPGKPGDKKAAGAAFKKGKDAFEKKDYKAARESFSDANEILPSPVASYWLARSDEELGEFAAASKGYDEALASGKLKEEPAADAKSRTEALKKKPVKVKVTSDPPGASIFVDGKAVPEKTPAEIEVAPGAHKLSLKADGKKDADLSVEAVAFVGATATATLEAGTPAVLAEPPSAAKTEPAKPVEPAKPAEPAKSTVTVAPDLGKRDMTWVYVTGGAAIVALGVGTFFGVQALSDKKDFDAANEKSDRQASLDARDKGTRNALISDMGFGIGITLAVTSAVLFFTRPAPEEGKAALTKPSTKLSFAPIVTSTTGGLAASVSF